MTKEREALKLALEALESKFLFIAGDGEAIDLRAKAITAIKEALAQPEHEWVRGECVKCGQSMEQPEQEPCCYGGIAHDCRADENCRIVKRMKATQNPPQRTWEPIETAPKDGTDVLLMYMHIDTQVVHNGFWLGASDTDDESDIGWWSYEHSEVSRIKLDGWMTPTHWLPLPKLKEQS